MCTFSRHEKLSKNADFSQFCVSFQRVRNGEALQTKDYIRCASTTFLQGSYQRCFAEAAAQKTPSAPWPTPDAADCFGLAAPLVNQQSSAYFAVHTLDSYDAPPRMLLSALTASVLDNPRQPTPPTDEGNAGTLLDYACPVYTDFE